MGLLGLPKGLRASGVGQERHSPALLGSDCSQGVLGECGTLWLPGASGHKHSAQILRAAWTGMPMGIKVLVRAGWELPEQHHLQDLSLSWELVWSLPNAPPKIFSYITQALPATVSVITRFCLPTPDVGKRDSYHLPSTHICDEINLRPGMTTKPSTALPCSAVSIFHSTNTEMVAQRAFVSCQRQAGSWDPRLTPGSAQVLLLRMLYKREQSPVALRTFF